MFCIVPLPCSLLFCCASFLTSRVAVLRTVIGHITSLSTSPTISCHFRKRKYSRADEQIRHTETLKLRKQFQIHTMGKVQKKQEQELRAIKGKAKTSEKAAKKAEVAKEKRASGSRKVVGQNIVVPVDTERPEPPYRYELHVKKAQCIVEVTLHKVPPSVIDISKTNRRHLIVDCGRYTKKFYLDFELPHNMTIDPETAEYTFENGILKCVLTSDTGAVPESAKKEREDFINKVKDQKHLRFRTTKEGELVVRSKLSMLKLKEEKHQKREEKRQEKAAAEKKAQAEDEATPAGSSKYLSDSDMAAMAASIGTKTKADIKAKVKALKAKESTFANKADERSSKKEARKEKQTGAFKRVVDEQRKKLAERIALSTPKPKDTSGKKVTFQ